MIVTPAEQQAVCAISAQLAAAAPCADGHHWLPASDEIGGRFYRWAYCCRCEAEDHAPEGFNRATRQLQEDML